MTNFPSIDGVAIIAEKIAELQQKLLQKETIDSYRLIHGRGRCFAGLEFINVDFFQPVLLLTCYKEPPVNWLDNLSAFLRDKLSEKLVCVLLQQRYLPHSPSLVLLGELPQDIFAQRGALKFHLHLYAQQNSGFFLDIEAGRQWLETHACGQRILNLFAYTCAFSVIAVAAGAEKVVNVDMSSSALNLGRSNHALNHLPKERSEFLAENILKSWGRIKRRGIYDLVIIDPPSYQKGSFVAEKDYVKVVRRLPELMPEGGWVLACLNAPELSEEFLKNVFINTLPDAEFVERIAEHHDFPDINSEQQLKLLVYKIAKSCN